MTPAGVEPGHDPTAFRVPNVTRHCSVVTEPVIPPGRPWKEGVVDMRVLINGPRPVSTALPPEFDIAA